jgi:C-terminal processing protease CtpA/Prc
VADGGPAQLADIREGDLISQVAEHDVATLPDFYRRLWAVGPAGTGVPLTAIRGGTRLHLNVRSVDRGDVLKRPQIARSMSSPRRSRAIRPPWDCFITRVTAFRRTAPIT